MCDTLRSYAVTHFILSHIRFANDYGTVVMHGSSVRKRCDSLYHLFHSVLVYIVMSKRPSAPPDKLSAQSSKRSNVSSVLLPLKRLDVSELGGGKYVSLSGKEAILKDLQSLGYIPDDVGCSRRRMQAARKEVADRMTPFGKLLMQREVNTDNGVVSYPFQNPLAMLHVAMSDGDRFAGYVRDAIIKNGEPTPAAPWSLVIYVDEVTCGNPLAVRSDARRKVQGVYWSLYQLGACALSDESCWFELAALRTSETTHFVGSVSHLLDVCLSCFFDPDGHDVRYGLEFHLKLHGPFRLSMVCEFLIADIKALVEAIGANGVSAILPCFLCRRILSIKAKQKPELASLDDFVDLGCLDQRRWGKHTNASILALLRELKVASTALPPTELKKNKHLLVTSI